jgi:CrcB protein
MSKLLWIALAGGLGTLARYGVTGLVHNKTGTGFPWGTFAVNAAGCLVFGFVLAAAETRLTMSPETRAAILVGFLGAFTTFSSFISETRLLAIDATLAIAGANLVGQTLLGFTCLVAGVALGRLL